MDERDALAMLTDLVGPAGDDAAVVDGHVLSIDMLHETTDFPDGVTRYTAGWRAVAASLSDLAAMGATPRAAVAAYAAPALDGSELESFVEGASAVCDRVGARYVGGDLDIHDEFTVATAVLGETERPVPRDGAQVGDAVFVTGTFGRTAAALDHFAAGEAARGNELMRVLPRTAAGQQLADIATAMIDSSDGLARSLHQLAEASDCGIAIEHERLPVHHELDPDDDRAWSFGEDFELVGTAPRGAFDRLDVDVEITEIGRVTREGVTMDGRTLPDRGYTHA